jgi:hypothetical protein
VGKFLCVKMGEVYSCKKMGLRRTLPLPRIPQHYHDYLYLDISPIGPFAHKHTSTRHTLTQKARTPRARSPLLGSPR